MNNLSFRYEENCEACDIERVERFSVAIVNDEEAPLGYYTVRVENLQVLIDNAWMNLSDAIDNSFIGVKDGKLFKVDRKCFIETI